jgi:mannose-6-phosphate isomerase-like protein (cupin superfamily)
MKTTVEEVLSRIPGPATVEWPTGERFAVGLAHGSMSVVYYAPVGNDPQTPHEQDEVYFIHKGTGALVIGEKRYSFKEGDCLFVPANAEHRFENFSEDFGTRAVFWGPKGGESGGEGGMEGKK